MVPQIVMDFPTLAFIETNYFIHSSPLFRTIPRRLTFILCSPEALLMFQLARPVYLEIIQLFKQFFRVNFCNEMNVALWDEVHMAVQ